MEVEGCHFSSNLGILVEPKIHFQHSALMRFSHFTSYPVGYREITSEDLKEVIKESYKDFHDGVT